jgi:hypothetical protein
MQQNAMALTIVCRVREKLDGVDGAKDARDARDNKDVAREPRPRTVAEQV